MATNKFEKSLRVSRFLKSKASNILQTVSQKLSIKKVSLNILRNSQENAGVSF